MRREVVRWFGLLAVPVLPLAIAACSYGGGREKAATAPATTTTATSKSHGAFVRTCATSVRGTLDPAWQKHSITAGPLSFYYADQYAGAEGSLFDPVPGKSGYYSGQKLLVLVRRGAVAKVVVPKSNRRYAALLYNPGGWNDRNAYRLEDGQSAVTFKACKEGQKAPVGGPPNAMTQFNGGFVVAGVRCIPLDIHVRGEMRAIPVTLSFGAGRCA